MAQAIKIPFVKMHGAGNDFVLLDAVTHPNLPTSSDFIRAIGDRHFGVGCDQVLMVAPMPPEAVKGEADFLYRIFNNTGEEVEQCGNGARCVAHYVFAKELLGGGRKEVRFAVRHGTVTIRKESDGRYAADFGKPRFKPKEIPFDETKCSLIIHDNMPMLQAKIKEVSSRFGGFAVVNMGNPHAVFFVRNLAELDIEPTAQAVQKSLAFPEGVNVGFVEIDEKSGGTKASIRVYERGAGETLACGTGTCAAFAAGVLLEHFKKEVSFIARGGKLACRWSDECEIILVGDAAITFEGEFFFEPSRLSNTSTR